MTLNLIFYGLFHWSLAPRIPQSKSCCWHKVVEYFILYILFTARSLSHLAASLHFSLVLFLLLLSLHKSFLLPIMCLVRLNSRCILAFPNPIVPWSNSIFLFLLGRVGDLLLPVRFLFPSLVRSSLFIYIAFLPPLLDFFFPIHGYVPDLGGAWRFVPFSQSWTLPLMIFSAKFVFDLHGPSSSLYVWCPAEWLPSIAPLSLVRSYHHCVPGICCISCALTCSTSSRLLKIPWRPGHRSKRLSSVVWRGLIYFLLIMEVCSRYPPQCYPHWWSCRSWPISSH